MASRIVDIVDTPFFSCEFFPPRTEKGVENLVARAKRLEAAGARFVSVTWGAGGSSALQSVELAKRLTQELSIPTMLHITCTNMDQRVLERALDSARQSGIRNILALRGDPPRTEYEYTSEFSNAADLVAWIRAKHGDYFCIGVAGYPEGHAQGSATEFSVQHDLPYLVKKIRNGADFIVTQLFYDAAKFVDYERTLRAHPCGLFESIPIIPGIMPINSYKTLLRSAKLSSASIPADINSRLSALELQDDEKIKQEGIDILCEIVAELQKNKVQGVHFYTLNLEKSVLEIVNRSNLGKTVEKPQTWDDFTNGRYTDPDSAAFGEIDGYGPVVHGAYDGAPNAQWGVLETSHDIADLLVRHITNEVEFIPFSDSPLSAETSLIQEELISLNERNLWTLASQPAAHKVDSQNKFFGWGPKDGLISQFPFVEVLAAPDVWAKLKDQVLSNPKIRYFAVNEKKQVTTNFAKGEKIAVTWGEWGSSIQNSTIITADSCNAWGDEVFGILRNWQQLYTKGSTTYKLMDYEASTRLLVTLVYLDTKEDFWKLI